MKVSPVRSAPAPAPLPTAAEAAANPALVAPAPAVRPRRGAGALAGAGLLGSLLAPTASAAGFVLVDDAPAPGATAETPAAAVPPSAAETEAAARAEAERAAVATVVAPILQKAMDEEGRGAFGCIAVDAPVVLSETEALNLIEQEFAKAGVKLRDAYELSGFTRTRTDWNAPRQRVSKEEWDPWRRLHDDGDPARPQKTEPAAWVFDLATEDGSILLEYLSTSDHQKLEDSDPHVWSTVTEYDFPRRAERFRAELATRTNGVPVTVGLFFDPMSSVYVWESNGNKHVRPDSALAALTEDEIKALDWQKRREIQWNDTRELLREQVRFFLDWARREGKLPAPSPQPEPRAESGGGSGEAQPHPVEPHAETAKIESHAESAKAAE